MRISDWSSDVCSSDLGPYGFAQTSSGTNYWIENNPAPYASGSVDNAPPTTDIIALGAGGLKTITFSQAVTDPYLALVSRSEEHTSELQSLMRISYAVFCLKKKNTNKIITTIKTSREHNHTLYI